MVTLENIKKIPKSELLELINKNKAKIKKHPTVIKMFEERGISLDELDLYPMCFAEMDVSARTEKGIVFFNYNLLLDGDFDNDDHYMVHEVEHILQQTSGDGPTKGSTDDTYLDNKYEQEGFQNQTEYLSDTRGDGVAESYIEQVLDHHDVTDPKERAEKRRKLLGSILNPDDILKIATNIKTITLNIDDPELAQYSDQIFQIIKKRYAEQLGMFKWMLALKFLPPELIKKLNIDKITITIDTDSNKVLAITGIEHDGSLQRIRMFAMSEGLGAKSSLDSLKQQINIIFAKDAYAELTIDLFEKLSKAAMLISAMDPSFDKRIYVYPAEVAAKIIPYRKMLVDDNGVTYQKIVHRAGAIGHKIFVSSIPSLFGIVGEPSISDIKNAKYAGQLISSDGHDIVVHEFKPELWKAKTAAKRLEQEGYSLPKSINILKYYEGQQYTYMHFTDNPQLIGINPKTEFSTPVGIYGYPITKDILNKISGRWFAADRKYIVIFKAKDPSTILNVDSYSEADLNEDIEKLEEYPEIDFLLSGTAASALYELNEHSKIRAFQKKPASRLFYILFSLSGGRASTFNKLLKWLGYSGANDSGHGIIHRNEPSQGFVLSRKDAEILDIIKNPYIIDDGKKTSPKYKQKEDIFENFPIKGPYKSDIKSMYDVDSESAELIAAKKLPPKDLLALVNSTNPGIVKLLAERLDHDDLHYMLNNDNINTNMNAKEILAARVDNDQDAIRLIKTGFSSILWCNLLLNENLSDKLKKYLISAKNNDDNFSKELADSLSKLSTIPRKLLNIITSIGSQHLLYIIALAINDKAPSNILKQIILKISNPSLIASAVTNPTSEIEKIIIDKSIINRDYYSVLSRLADRTPNVETQKLLVEYFNKSDQSGAYMAVLRDLAGNVNLDKDVQKILLKFNNSQINNKLIANQNVSDDILISLLDRDPTIVKSILAYAKTLPYSVVGAVAAAIKETQFFDLYSYLLRINGIDSQLTPEIIDDIVANIPNGILSSLKLTKLSDDNLITLFNRFKNSIELENLIHARVRYNPDMSDRVIKAAFGTKAIYPILNYVKLSDEIQSMALSTDEAPTASFMRRHEALIHLCRNPYLSNDTQIKLLNYIETSNDLAVITDLATALSHNPVIIKNQNIRNTFIDILQKYNLSYLLYSIIAYLNSEDDAGLLLHLANTSDNSDILSEISYKKGISDEILAAVINNENISTNILHNLATQSTSEYIQSILMSRNKKDMDYELSFNDHLSEQIQKYLVNKYGVKSKKYQYRNDILRNIARKTTSEEVQASLYDMFISLPQHYNADQIIQSLSRNEHLSKELQYKILKTNNVEYLIFLAENGGTSEDIQKELYHKGGKVRVYLTHNPKLLPELKILLGLKTSIYTRTNLIKEAINWKLFTIRDTEEEENKRIDQLLMNLDVKAIRDTLAASSTTPAWALEKLVKLCDNPEVQIMVINNENVTDHILLFLMRSKNKQVSREARHVLKQKYRHGPYRSKTKIAGRWDSIIRGEWWIDQYGNEIFADQDTGDVGHEMVAADMMLDKDVLMDGLREHYKNSLEKGDIDDGAYNALISELKEYKHDDVGGGGIFFNLQVPDSVGIKAAGSAEIWNAMKEDIREAYSKYYNATLVINTNFFVWKLNDASLSAIHSFIYNQISDSDELTPDDEILVEESSTGRHVTLSLSDFLNIKHAEELWKYALAYTDMVKEATTSDVMILQTGTKLYHGSVSVFADKIKEERQLRGNLWTRENQKQKISGGTMEEEGLIWFSLDKKDAESFALGQELYYEKAKELGYDKGFAHKGTVFTYVVDRPIKLINRYKKLTNSEAKKLERINPRKYDPIKSGLSLSIAAYKLYQGGITYKQILPALGYDGIIHNEKHIAILADRLKISGHEDVEMSEENILSQENRLKQLLEAREKSLKEKRQTQHEDPDKKLDNLLEKAQENKEETEVEKILKLLI